MINDINNFYSMPGVQADTTMVISEGTITHSPQNAGLRVEFFIAYPPNQIETDKAGVLKTSPVECVRIRQIGDDLTAAVHPVTEEIKQRFPQEYKNWELSKNNDFISGTPLSDWEMMDGGMAQEMASAGVRSVENLDANISRFMNGHLWRKKAQIWVEQNKQNGPMKTLQAKNEELQARLESLESMLKNNAIPAPANALDGIRDSEFQRGRGRPRKEVAVEQPATDEAA
jgi:hypothetical protein